MKSVLKLNKISLTIVDRLLESEFLYTDMSADETYLRLCFYYQELPLFFALPENVRDRYFEQVRCSSVIAMQESKKFPLTLVTISEILGIPVKYLEKLVKLLNLRKIPIPTDNLLHGFGGRFYTPSDIDKLLRRLSGDIDNGRVTPHASNRHLQRIYTGWGLLHPEGATGIAAARELFNSECQKLLNPPSPVQQLTYDNLDYTNLNWKKILHHENFARLHELYICPSNKYLIQFMGTDAPTEAMLITLAAQAASIPRNNGYTGAQHTTNQTVSADGETNFPRLVDLMSYMNSAGKVKKWDYLTIYNKFSKNIHKSDIFDEIKTHLSELSVFTDGIETKLGERLLLNEVDICELVGVDTSSEIGGHILSCCAKLGSRYDYDEALRRGMYSATPLGDEAAIFYILGYKGLIQMLNVLNNYLRSPPESEKNNVLSKLTPTTIYQVVKHEIEKVHPDKFVDYGKAMETLHGTNHIYKNYIDEIQDNIHMLKCFSQNSPETMSCIYIKPEDLGYLVSDEPSVLSLVRQYTTTFGSDLLREVDDVKDSNKFYIVDIKRKWLPDEGEGIIEVGREYLSAICTVGRIVEALERLNSYLETMIPNTYTTNP